MNHFHCFFILCAACFHAATAAAQQDLFDLNEETMDFIEPTIYESAVAPQDERAQALMYYAVDTEDPFMQLAVDHEVRTMIRSCNGELAPNFALIINSHLVNPANGRIHVCRAGVLSTMPLPDGLEIPYILRKATDPNFDPVAYLKGPNKQPKDDLLFLVPIGLDGPPELRRYYGTYPLSYVIVLRRIWSYVMKRIFPIKDYLTHVHLKSHGTANLVLSGFDRDLLKLKRNEQYETWSLLNKKRAAKNLATIDLPLFPYGQAGLRPVTADEEKLLAEYGFGRVCDQDCRNGIKRSDSSFGQDLNTDVFIHHLNHRGGLGLLGQYIWQRHVRNGLHSLGSTHNSITEYLNNLDLSSKNYFGTSFGELQLSSNFGGIMQMLSTNFEDEDPEFPASLNAGFLFIESCLTGKERKIDFTDFMTSKQGHVAAAFAPAGTIWYRNFDWDIIFEAFKEKRMTSKQAVHYVADWARVVPNFVRLPEPKHQIRNQCKVPVYLTYRRVIDHGFDSALFQTKKQITTSGVWTIPAGYHGHLPFSSGDDLRLSIYSNLDTLRGAMANGKLGDSLTPVCVSNKPYFRFDLSKELSKIAPHDDRYEEVESAACKDAGGFMKEGMSPLLTSLIDVSACAATVKICYDSDRADAPPEINVAMYHNDQSTNYQYRMDAWYIVKRGERNAPSCVTLRDIGFSTYFYVEGYKPTNKSRLVWRDENSSKTIMRCLSSKAMKKMSDEDCAALDDRRFAEFWNLSEDHFQKDGSYTINFGFD